MLDTVTELPTVLLLVVLGESKAMNMLKHYVFR